MPQFWDDGSSFVEAAKVARRERRKKRRLVVDNRKSVRTLERILRDRSGKGPSKSR